MSYYAGLGGGGAPTPTVIDYTPGAADISYTESGGVLTGVGGVFDGWNVANWADIIGLSESDANNWIEFNWTQPGQGYCYYDLDWLDDEPYVYKTIKGDFSLMVAFDSTNGGDAQRSPAIGIGRLDDDGSWNAMCSFEMLGWSATQGQPTVGCRTYTTTKLYNGGAQTYPWYLRMSRTGGQIKWEDSSDGESWTERIDRSLDPGGEVRMFIGAGGNGGADNKMWITKITASYYEV